jgi:hypothetical protein
MDAVQQVSLVSALRCSYCRAISTNCHGAAWLAPLLVDYGARNQQRQWAAYPDCKNNSEGPRNNSERRQGRNSTHKLASHETAAERMRS